MKKLFALIALVGLGGFVAGCGDTATPPPATKPAGMTGTPGTIAPPSGVPAKTGDAAKEVKGITTGYTGVHGVRQPVYRASLFDGLH